MVTQATPYLVRPETEPAVVMERSGVYRQPDSPYWMIRFRYKGRLIRESSRTTSKRGALAYRRRRVAEIGLGKGVIGAEVPTLGEAAEALLRGHASDCENCTLRASSLAPYPPLQERWGEQGRERHHQHDPREHCVVHNPLARDGERRANACKDVAHREQQEEDADLGEQRDRSEFPDRIEVVESNEREVAQHDAHEELPPHLRLTEVGE